MAWRNLSTFLVAIIKINWIWRVTFHQYQLVNWIAVVLLSSRICSLASVAMGTTTTGITFAGYSNSWMRSVYSIAYSDSQNFITTLNSLMVFFVHFETASGTYKTTLSETRKVSPNTMLPRMGLVDELCNHLKIVRNQFLVHCYIPIPHSHPAQESQE